MDGAYDSCVDGCRIVIFAKGGYHEDDGEGQHAPAKLPPQFPTVMMGEFPGVSIFHGHGSAVAEEGVDFLWGV